MPFTLGKPGCPKCKGDGVFPAEDRVIVGPGGREVRYPQVERCSCLSKPIEEESPVDRRAGEGPDAQTRAAGESA
jgi:hypothetical protein